jgi:hypothetical protein
MFLVDYCAKLIRLYQTKKSNLIFFNHHQSFYPKIQLIQQVRINILTRKLCKNRF